MPGESPLADPDARDSSELYEKLTPAERRVLAEAIKGEPIKLIAHRLGLSTATVRSHLSTIYDKLNVQGRVQLLATLRSAGRSVGIQGRSSRRSPLRGGSMRAALLAMGAAGVAALLIVLISRPAVETLPELRSRLEAGTVRALEIDGPTVRAVSTDGSVIELRDVTPSIAMALAREHGLDAYAGRGNRWLELFLLPVPVIVGYLGLIIALVLIGWAARAGFRRLA